MYKDIVKSDNQYYISLDLGENVSVESKFDRKTLIEKLMFKRLCFHQLLKSRVFVVLLLLGIVFCKYSNKFFFIKRVPFDDVVLLVMTRIIIAVHNSTFGFTKGLGQVLDTLVQMLISYRQFTQKKLSIFS